MKKIVGVLAASIVLATAVIATDTRLDGFGVTSWMVTDDDTAIWLNPADVNTYSGYLWGELGNATVPAGVGSPQVNNNLAMTNQWGGVSTKFLIGNFALFVGRPYRGFIERMGIRGGSDVDDIPDSPLFDSMCPADITNPVVPVGKFDMFYALRVSDIDVGASVSFASDGDSEDRSALTDPLNAGDTQTKQSRQASDMNFSLGAKLSNLGLFSSLGATLGIGIHGAQYTFTQQNYSANTWILRDDWSFKNTGAMDIDFNLRGIVKNGNATSFVVFFDYLMADLSSEFLRKTDSNLSQTYEPAGGDEYYKLTQTYNTSRITLGVSSNLQLNQNMLLVLGAGIISEFGKISDINTQLFSIANGVLQEYTLEGSNISLPVNVGFEYIVSKFATLRTGVSKQIINGTETRVTDPNYDTTYANGYPLLGITRTTIGSDGVTEGITLSIGTGLNLTSNLKVDMFMRQEILFSGTYLLSGLPESLVSQISAIYKF